MQGNRDTRFKIVTSAVSFYNVAAEYENEDANI